MFTSTTVYLYLAFALIMALIPFLINAPLVYFPREIRLRSLFLALLSALLWVAGIVLIGVWGDTLWQLLLGIVCWVFGVLIAVLTADRTHKKSFFYRFFEWCVFYFVVGAVGFAVDQQYFSATNQSWQFYAITLCIFLTMAYPGFVYRHLWLGKHHKV